MSQPDLSSGLGCTGQPDMAPHRHCQQRVTPKLQQIQPLNARVVHRIFFSSFVHANTCTVHRRSWVQLYLDTAESSAWAGG